MAATHSKCACFGDLPLELREMIWLRALPESRIVECAQKFAGEAGYKALQDRHTRRQLCILHTATNGLQILRSRSEMFASEHRRAYNPNEAALPIPIILHICAESRRVALTKLVHCYHPAHSGFDFYLNPEIDELFLGEHTFFDIASKTLQTYDGQLSGIKTLLVRMQGGDPSLNREPNSTYFHYLRKILLHRLDSIQHVRVILDDDMVDYRHRDKKSGRFADLFVLNEELVLSTLLARENDLNIPRPPSMVVECISMTGVVLHTSQTPHPRPRVEGQVWVSDVPPHNKGVPRLTRLVPYVFDISPDDHLEDDPPWDIDQSGRWIWRFAR